MFIKIIGSFVVLGLFLLLNKLSIPFIGEETFSAEVLSVGLIAMVTFLVGLIFFG